MSRHRPALLLLLQQQLATVLCDCAHDYQDCTASKCCTTAGFGCFKRPSKAYAQCRPYSSPCEDSDEWMCPGWELCGERYDACFGTRCCQSTNDQCYAKSAAYAQCLQKDTCIDKVGQDGTKWQCTELLPVQSCSANWDKCMSSRCCSSPGFKCYRHNDRYAQCMDKCEPSDTNPCTPHDKGLAAAAAAPPSAAPPALCSGPMEECTHSRCCSKEARPPLPHPLALGLAL